MIPSSWGRLGLGARLSLIIMLVLFVAGVALSSVMAHQIVVATSNELHIRLKARVASLSSICREPAIVGDYATIEQALQNQARMEDAQSVAFNDNAGHRLASTGNVSDLSAPAWFVGWLSLGDFRAQGSVEAGGRQYGEVEVVLSPNRAINAAWANLVEDGAIGLLTLAAVIGGVLLLLDRGLRPLKDLVAAAHAYENGDASIRVAMQGGPEFMELIGAFNHMADGLNALLTDLRSNEQELRQAKASVEEANLNLERRVAQRTAELERMNRELEGFSYSISHDLRAPLRAIHGFSHLLKEEYGAHLDDAATQYLERIGHNANRMGELIDDLLDFSRMSRREMALEQVDMTALLQEVLGEVRATEPDRNIVLHHGILAPARGDRAMIRQVLVNLLSNAVKFTAPRVEALIEVEAAVSGEYVGYTVKDNGVGFDMQYADKLFGVFQRLHRPAEFPGTGIGLALVKRIVERHGGRVWATSKVGEGATFGFTLPSARACS